MDFGNYEGLRKPHAFVSADMILFRGSQNTHDLLDEIEILVSTRKIEPFQNYLSLTFGGYIDPTDDSPLHTAIRETKEESGIDLYKLTPREFTFLGSFGPARIHQGIKKNSNARAWEPLTITEDTDELGNPRPCVTFVFTFCCTTEMEGSESDEAKSIQWMSVKKIITEYGNMIAFDHAAFLQTLIHRLHKYDDDETSVFKQSHMYVHYDKPYDKP